MSLPVHLVNYASQPDLQIWCDQSWTVPAYGAMPNGQPYETDDGRRYAFDWLFVTCSACLHKLDRSTITAHLTALRWRRHLREYGCMPVDVMDADAQQRARMRAFVAKHGDKVGDLMSPR